MRTRSFVSLALTRATFVVVSKTLLLPNWRCKASRNHKGSTQTCRYSDHLESDSCVCPLLDDSFELDHSQQVERADDANDSPCVEDYHMMMPMLPHQVGCL